MADPRTPIELIAPMGSCPVKETQPTFLWRSLGSAPTLRPTPTGRVFPTLDGRELAAETRWRR